MKKLMVLFSICILIFTASELDAQKKGQGRMFLGGEAGISVPMGDFGDAVNMGFGLNALFHYFVIPNLAINTSLGYWTWGYDGDVDGSLTDIPWFFGAFYEFYGDGFNPIIGADLGLHFLSGSDVEYQGITIYKGDSDTKFGFSPYAGAAIPISDGWDFRGILKFNIVEDGNHFNIQFGVRKALK